MYRTWYHSNSGLNAANNFFYFSQLQLIIIIMNKLLVCAALGLALAVTEIRYVHTAKSYSGLVHTWQ